MRLFKNCRSLSSKDLVGGTVEMNCVQPRFILRRQSSGTAIRTLVMFQITSKRRKLYREGTQLGIMCFLFHPDTYFVFSTFLSMNRNESRLKIHTRTFLWHYQWKHSFPFCLLFQGNTIQQLTFNISVNI